MNDDNYLIIDFGFYVLNKGMYSSLLKKTPSELKSILDSKVKLCKYDEDFLSQVLFDVDEETFNLKKELFYHRTEELDMISKDLTLLYSFLVSCVFPLSDYFFMEPALYLSCSNFNLLDSNSFIKKFYSGDYIPTNFLDIEYSLDFYILDEDETERFIKDIVFLKGKNIKNEFDKRNSDFLNNFLEEFDFKEDMIILAKSI